MDPSQVLGRLRWAVPLLPSALWRRRASSHQLCRCPLSPSPSTIPAQCHLQLPVMLGWSHVVWGEKARGDRGLETRWEKTLYLPGRQAEDHCWNNIWTQRIP